MSSSTTPTQLSVNVNKIATLRNARGGDNPNVVHAAQTCIDAGCYGITVHPRPDERHIHRTDVLELADLLKGTSIEFNIEGYPSERYMALVDTVRPTQCTLVPDPPGILTSNAGWDLSEPPAGLADTIQTLRKMGSRVSLFLDPNPNHIRRAAQLGADRIELYTGPYAEAFGTPQHARVLETYVAAAHTAHEVGLGLNAGHDLDRSNLPTLVHQLPHLLEVSIGHALICDALYMGLAAAVRSYLAALEPSP